MKFQLYSDMHIEMHNSYPKIPSKADILILAGDIGKIKKQNFKDFICYCSKTWKHVIFVLGNHEFYDNIDLLVMKDMYKAYFDTFDNVYLLDDDHLDITDQNDQKSYRFIGSVLWSNPSNIINLCDFSQIHETILDTTTKKLELTPMTLDTFKLMHDVSKKFIRDALQKAKLENIIPILITHFPPIRKQTSHPKYANSPNNDYFTNSLDDIKIDTKDVPLWISGHTHYSYDIMKNNTRFLSNQMGYPDENCSVTKFNASGIYEI